MAGPHAFRVALVQLDARSDVDANLARARDLAGQAAATGARLIALPEYFQGGIHGSAVETPRWVSRRH